MITYQKPNIKSVAVFSSSLVSQYLDCNSNLTCDSPLQLGAGCIDGTPDQVIAVFFLPGVNSVSGCSLTVNGTPASSCELNIAPPGFCTGGTAAAVQCDADVTCNGIGTDEVVVTCNGFPAQICRSISEKK